jgi:glutamate/tyrosine decarboxylase-like PLP-dependent enzyme
VSCVGTTGCGAVDPVHEIGLIARKYSTYCDTCQIPYCTETD